MARRTRPCLHTGLTAVRSFEESGRIHTGLAGRSFKERTSAAPRCSGAEPEAGGSGKFQLYPSRWVQLGYLSALALLSDWVCFSVAAAPETWEATYGHDPATLIDIFLFTNVLFCFLEPAVVRRLGLRAVIIGAAFLMTTGCLLRSGVPFTGAEPVYSQIVAGTVLVGAAQPFFQCTPPLLSATWFGSDERALSTAIAINFNQVGRVVPTVTIVADERALSTAIATNVNQLGRVVPIVSIVTSPCVTSPDALKRPRHQLSD